MGIIPEYRLPRRAPVHHMIPGTLKFDAQRSRHALEASIFYYNIARFDPYSFPILFLSAPIRFDPYSIVGRRTLSFDRNESLEQTR